MFRRLRIVIFYLTLLTLLAKGGVVAAVTLYPRITQPGNDTVSARALIEMTNQYRAQLDLDPLTPNARLTQAAINKAHDLFAGQYFDHTSPDGRRFSQWIRDVHYEYFYVGENLAINYTNTGQVFAAWLASERHRDNIIRDNYQEIGIAVIEGMFEGRPTTIVVQLFGTRISGSSLEPETAMYDLGGVAGTQAWYPPVSLTVLDQLNLYLTYCSVGMILLALLTYRPHRIANHRIIRPASAIRYQANTAREW